MVNITPDIGEASGLPTELFGREKYQALADTLGNVATAAAQLQEARNTLDEAVFIARDVGATWADIGRAVGISHQAANQRWAKKLPDNDL